MDGGFILIVLTGVVNNQIRMKHYATEAEARTAADMALSEGSRQVVAVVPSLFYARADSDPKNNPSEESNVGPVSPGPVLPGHGTGLA